MSKRRAALACGAVVAIVLAVGLPLCWPDPLDSVTHENRDRIARGMTLAEVEAILGRPANRVYDAEMFVVRVWDGRKYNVVVFFGEDGRVSFPPDGVEVNRRWYDWIGKLFGF